MVIQQKMTPTSADPMQEKMMLFMPVVFTFLFWGFPTGLVLYWLINNVISIGQQYYINKRLPEGGTRMDFIEVEGKTYEEAVKKASAGLNAEEKDLDIEVTEVDTKGILGLLGSKKVRIVARVRNTPEEFGKKFLTEVDGPLWRCRADRSDVSER